MTVRFYRIV